MTRGKALIVAILMGTLWIIPFISKAQSWDISDRSTTGNSVTAVLSGNTLTISGNGNMADFDVSATGIPWNSYLTQIKTVVINSGVTNIGNISFQGCINLQTITIPSTVTIIGSRAFQDCHVLSSVTIPNSVTAIESQAFNSCLNLKTFTIEDGTVVLRFVGSSSQSHFANTSVETLYLGRDIETAFINGDYSDGCPFINSALKSVTIGNSVTTINDNSFQLCTGLQSLILGNGLITIGNYAISGCISLAGTLSLPNKVKTIGNGAFQDCHVLSSVTIPKSVTSIGSQAFNSCLNLKTVTIEDGTEILRFVGSYSQGHFANTSVETLYLGRDLETAFINGDYSDGCPFTVNTALKSLTIGNNVTAINDYSFQSCIGLASITIQSHVASIGNSAFSGCNGLTEIHSQNPAPPTAVDDCFYNVYATCKLYVPTVDKYSVAPEWKKFFTILPTGINDVILNQLSIYPNPAKDDIFIKSDLQIRRVEICSLAGSLLISENNSTEKISVSALPQGVYLLKVYTDKSMTVSKFVKE